MGWDSGDATKETDSGAEEESRKASAGPFGALLGTPFTEWKEQSRWRHGEGISWEMGGGEELRAQPKGSGREKL